MSAFATEATRFALVGVAATALHAATALILAGIGLEPNLANAAAFAAAFNVSLAGHCFWTFRDRRVALRRAAPRLAATALAGFAANATILQVALGHMTVALALPVSAVAGAVATFALARVWAFRRDRAAAGDRTGRSARHVGDVIRTQARRRPQA